MRHAHLTPAQSRIPEHPLPPSGSGWPGPDAAAVLTSRSAKRRAAKKARKERYSAECEPDEAELERREREAEQQRLEGLVCAARERYRRLCERLQELAGAELDSSDGASGASDGSGCRPGAQPPDGADSDDGTCGVFGLSGMSSPTVFTDALSSLRSPSACVPDAWSDTSDDVPRPSFDPTWFLAASFTPPLPYATILPPAALAIAEETALVLELLSKAGTVEMELAAQTASLQRACENMALLRREAGGVVPRADAACVVCCDAGADAVLLPCRHLVTCLVRAAWWVSGAWW